MQINISTKAVLGVVGTIALSVTSWLLLDHIDHGNRLTRLEGSGANDARQDQELAEIRATMRDLIRLTTELATSHGDMHPGHEPEPVLAEEPIEPAVEDLPEEYGDFRMEQHDLEHLLRRRGIEPTKKGEDQ